MQVLLIAVAAVWGAGAGLLVPRVVHRLAVEPGQAWRAACPRGHPITGPCGGWLGRARCPKDGAYGPSSPVVASATAVICAVLAAATGARPELVVWLLAAPVAVVLSLVDGAVARLPDVLTLPLAAALALLLGLAALLPGSAGSWRGALLGGAGLGVAYLLLVVLNPSGLGLGDAKLALALGLALGWYGWPVLFAGSLLGLVLGVCYGLGQLALRRRTRAAGIPLGPFMAAGAFAALLLGAATAP